MLTKEGILVRLIPRSKSDGKFGKIHAMNSKTILLAAVCTVAANLAHAQFGTIGLVDLGTPAVSPGPSIAFGTAYQIGNLASFTDVTGVFSTLPSPQIYGPVTFQPGVANSFSFGDAVFGN